MKLKNLRDIVNFITVDFERFTNVKDGVRAITLSHQQFLTVLDALEAPYFVARDSLGRQFVNIDGVDLVCERSDGSYVKMPQSDEEARAMLLVASNYLGRCV